MKRIVIIGEGQTEQSFCNDVLQPHFTSKEIYLHNTVIKKNHGGIVNWSALKYQIEKHLLEDTTVIVTTLIDYYGIHKNHKYPNWQIAESQSNPLDRMLQLEKGMAKDISANLRSRFIPYIQLHEFEGLLFSDVRAFEDIFEKKEFNDYNYLISTISENDSPELINKGTDTAPSKRLNKILKRYRKVLHGSLIAQNIGLNKIRQKCYRFDKWIMQMENI
jgi:hypothetical protein